MAVSGIWRHTNDNDWNTPKSAWKKIFPLLDKSKTYWCPFYNDGYCKSVFEEEGFDVIHDEEDFWETMHRGTVVVDNPPYRVKNYKGKNIPNVKDKIMRRLIYKDIPFCLLFPTTTIHTQYFKKLQDKYGGFQLVCPSEKINFEKYEGDKSKCLFYTTWICWNMNFDKDFLVV